MSHSGSANEATGDAMGANHETAKVTRTSRQFMADLRGKLEHALVMAHVGESGSRSLIATPALVCDLDLLTDNLQRMSNETASAGVALRPHAKTHKSAFIARQQLDAGAIGLSFAKLSEAETIVGQLIANGYTTAVSALLTTPLVGAAAAARAAALATRCDLLVVVDHVDGVTELTVALDAHDATITVLCDVDVGQRRSGVVSASEAVTLVGHVVSSAHLRFGGVQGYGGHLQHIAGHEERHSAAVESSRRLREVIFALEEAGHEVSIRTGGGTGTALIDIEIGVLNELQPGSYVFMDREYRDALSDDPEGAFAQSLSIMTTVISANQRDFVTVDAGFKAMATDAGAPVVVGYEGLAVFRFSSDEQGIVTNPINAAFQRGQQLTLVPPHCDPTVDKYDVIWLVRGDVVIDVIEVTARGRSQ